MFLCRRYSLGLCSDGIYSYGPYSYGHHTAMACIVTTYVVMANIVVAYIVMAYIVSAYRIMAYIVMAYILMATYLKEARMLLRRHDQWPRHCQHVHAGATHTCICSPAGMHACTGPLAREGLGPYSRRKWRRQLCDGWGVQKRDVPDRCGPGEHEHTHVCTRTRTQIYT